jgi:hypothetical protein
VLERLEDRLAHRGWAVGELDALATESDEPASVLIQHGQLEQLVRSA